MGPRERNKTRRAKTHTGSFILISFFGFLLVAGIAFGVGIEDTDLLAVLHANLEEPVLTFDLLGVRRRKPSLKFKTMNRSKELRARRWGKPPNEGLYLRCLPNALLHVHIIAKMR